MVRRIMTEGINHSGLLGIGVVALILVLGWWWFRGGPEMFTPSVTTDQSRPSQPLPPNIVTDPDMIDDALPEVAEPGVFAQYNEQYLASLDEDSRVVLFFTTTSGCSLCQQAEISIYSNQHAIPTNVHILLVDHVSSPILRRAYEVTTPHTFVEIRPDGTMVQKWRASRDLQSILARL